MRIYLIQWLRNLELFNLIEVVGMEFKGYINSLIEKLKEKNSGKTIGSIVGFFMGALILYVGFLKTLFVILCALIGFVIGKRADDKDDLMEIVNKIIPSGFKRY